MQEPSVRTAMPSAAAAIEMISSSDAVLLNLTGAIDERFAGFGDPGAAKAVVLNVSGVTRITSFGVRQWLVALEALPKSIGSLYLLGCPTFFVDQLNMVLKFGGPSKVLTVQAPYVCTGCGAESSETIDVLAQRATLQREPPERQCARCNAKLEFDETPESYFAFVGKYAAASFDPAAAQLLAAHGLYATDAASDTPPRIIKLVHGPVTYFRVSGTVGSAFRSRPLLVGIEGEVVIDLADVDRFLPAGHREWHRLIKALAQQATATTLVDVPATLLDVAGETLTLARTLSVASLKAPYTCSECDRSTSVSVTLADMTWPLQFPDGICPTCGGPTVGTILPERLKALQKASTFVVPKSARVVERRAELLSRALTDANVARAGAVAAGEDEMVLGKYKIVRALSAGGMAEVFLAKQVGIGGFEKPVAIKRIQNKLLESRHQAIELFLNEAKIAGRLSHPNIAQVLDVGQAGGALYLAMEYIHGKDLRDVVKELRKSGGVFPIELACLIVREVAHALDYAFWSTDLEGKRLNVVHRDVSSHNVILGFDGTVKLIDFGVAVSAITEHEPSLIVGKWTYMAPETTLNGHADHRSDLFSLGVTLYLLCSGTMPFTGKEPKEIVRKIRAGEYRRIEEIAPRVPARIAALVSRMMSPNPDDRPQRGQEVAAELTDAAREYSYEATPQKLADFVSRLFVSQAEFAGPTDVVIRVYPDQPDSVAPTQIAKSAHSITPSAQTGQAPRFSESLPITRGKAPTGSLAVLARSAESLAAAATVPKARHAVEPTRAWTDRAVNVVIALTIIAVVVLGAYLIISNY